MYTTKTLKENLDASSGAVAPALKIGLGWWKNHDFTESREFSSHFFSFSRFLDSRESKKLEKFDITTITEKEY